MSLSINDLLQSLGAQSKQIKPKEGQLHNPDIPDSEPMTELDAELELRDQYSTVMKIGGAYNGTNAPLKESGQLRMMDPRQVDFLMTDAIDPNIIRSKTDPDTAQPSYNRYSLFSLMPDSIKPPRSQVGLIRRSNGSSTNYRNRFQAAPPKTSSKNAARQPPAFDEPHDSYNEPDYDPPAYDFNDGIVKPKKPIHVDPDGERTHTGTGIVGDHDQVDEEPIKPTHTSGSKPTIHTIYDDIDYDFTKKSTQPNSEIYGEDQ